MTEDDAPSWMQWEQNFIVQMQRLRESRGMTQTELARTMKAYGLPFHQQTIQRIESGERPVRLNEAHLLARSLGVDLASMTDSGEPSDRQIRYIVDDVRRASDRASEDIQEVTGEWLNTVEGFTVEVMARLTASLHPADGQPGKPDDVSRWGLAWGYKVLMAFHQLRHAYEALAVIGTRGYESLSADTKEMIDYLAHGCETWSDDQVKEASRAHPDRLHASFPGLPEPLEASNEED